MSEQIEPAQTAFNCDFELEEDVRFRCSICRYTMLKPMSLPCGHSGCSTCLETLSNERGSKCPTCSAVYDYTTLKITFALNEYTSSFKVFCKNSGCGWKGVYGDAPGHFNQCPKMAMECPNSDCNYVALREDLAAHSATCVKRSVPCPDCHKSVTWESLTTHKTDQCSNPSTDCPLNCGLKMPRSSIVLHLHQCGEKATKCKVDGCTRILKRKDVAEHVQEAASSHYSLQLEEVQRLRRSLFDRRRNTEVLQLKEDRVASFTWKIERFPACIRQQWDSGSEPLTSDTFIDEGRKWRAVLTGERNLFLHLVSSSNPVTVEIRIVLMPGEAVQSTKRLTITTIKEGGMWGLNIDNISRWVNEDGMLNIKFIIFYLSL